MAAEKEKKKGKVSSQKMLIKYVFPNDLPDLHVSGAWAGITPRDEICIHFYSERRPVPKSVTYKVSADGDLSDEKTETGGDIIRLMQASLVMDINAVMQLREILDSVIMSFEDEEAEE